MGRRYSTFFMIVSVAAAVGLTGCEAPPKRVVTHPPGTLRVMYEVATAHSTCLVASVAMAANYLTGQRRFSEESIRAALKEAGRDETRVGDLKAFLAEQELYLLTLTGTCDEKPPLGLKYWVKSRGYPVICVINREGNDAAFNHAVVVIGISANPEGGTTDIVQYLDPSSADPLHGTSDEAFEKLWARGGHAMMVVVAPPTDSGRSDGRKSDGAAPDGGE